MASRRQFVGILTGASVAGLIAACTPAPTVAPTAGSATRPIATSGASGGVTPTAAGATAAAPKSGPMPSYIPLPSGPKPDYHSADPRVSDGFDNYPRPYQSWIKAPPGTGSTVNIYAIAYYPPPTLFDQNPTWQEVNKQLNANVQMTIFAGLTTG